ncbi:MAG: copper resistance protein CopD [Streptosporangiales bacterium]|nr:copper resistance protein CopD [Streptosporangiales bacterium]
MTEQTSPPATRPGQWWPWSYALGVLLLGGGVLALALWVGGGTPTEAPPGLPDPGPFVGWALPGARLLTDVATVLAAGLTLTAALLLPPGEQTTGGLTVAGRRLVRTAGVAAGVGLVTAAAELVLTYADFLGIPVTAAVADAGLSSFVVEIVQGRALLAQLVLLGVVVLAVSSARTTRGAGGLALAAVAAATVPALSGHSAGASDHMLAQASLLVHISAATLWLGGLAGVALLARRGDAPLATVAGRFSTLALWCVVAVGLSGLANAWVRLGTPAEIASSYGVLVIGKTVALVALGALGWWHRARTLPRLATSRRPFVRLAAVELAVMGATVGLAVGISRSVPPVPDDGSGTISVAESIHGFPPPPPFQPWRLVTEIYPDGYWLTFALVAGALYATGLRVLRARGDAWPVGRTVSWYAGLLVIVVLTCTGVGKYAAVLFSVHMVQHMSFNMLVPILLVLAGPITLALRALPAHRDRTGLRQLLLDLLKSKVVRFLTHPLVASAIFVVSLYLVYFTGLFDLLMRDHWGHLAMQVHFLLSGGLFFWVLVGIDPGSRRLPYPMRMVLLLAVMAGHAFFSVALMSFGRPIAGEYYRLLQIDWLPDLVADQQLGGGIGWAFGEIPVLVVLGALFVQWVRADRRRAAAIDRALDRAEAEQLAKERENGQTLG